MYNQNQKNMTPQEELAWKQATQFRQTAVWGMHTIKSAFPCIKEKIMYETKGRQEVMLNLMVLLYSYRLKHVGLNEIETTFVGALRNRVYIYGLNDIETTFVGALRNRVYINIYIYINISFLINLSY
jgi:hypothetical protein